MENEELISVETICEQYRIESSFIHSLNDYGLIEIVRVEESDCLNKEDLRDLESMMNLYYELHINMEGIDAINHLLQRVREMQKEIILLKNRLGHF